MKNKLFVIISVILSIILLSSLILFFVIKPYQQEFASPGAKLITNGIQPHINPTGPIQCLTNECIVYGTMVVTKPATVDTWKCFQPSTGNCPSTYKGCNIAHTSLAACELYENTRCNVCQKVTSYEYKANWNFKPSGDTNFEYANKVYYGNSVTSLDKIVTSSAKITKDQSISFLPTYADGTRVESYKVTVESYDTTCTRLLADKTSLACNINSNVKLCTPSYASDFSINDCSKSGAYGTCPDGTKSFAKPGVGCQYGTETKSWCKGTANYSLYKECVANSLPQPSGITCDGFTKDSKATSPQVCLTLLSGNKSTGAGLGVIGCANDVCKMGETEGALGATTFKYCKDEGSNCFVKASKSCPFDQVNQIQLVYDGDMTCGYPGANKCSRAGDTKCDTTNINKIYTCKFMSMVDSGITIQAPYQWKMTSEFCLGNQECRIQSTGAALPSCGCAGLDKCDAGTIDCITTSSYKRCESVNNNCLDWGTLTNTNNNQTCNINTDKLEDKTSCYYSKLPNNGCAIPYEICKTNVNPEGVCTCIEGKFCATNANICVSGVCKPVGCAYNNTPNTAIYIKDYACNSMVENCLANKCVVKDNPYKVAIEDIALVTKCFENDIRINTKYTTRSNGNVNIWEPKSTCVGTDKPVCQDFAI